MSAEQVSLVQQVVGFVFSFLGGGVVVALIEWVRVAGRPLGHEWADQDMHFY